MDNAVKYHHLDNYQFNSWQNNAKNQFYQFKIEIHLQSLNNYSQSTQFSKKKTASKMINQAIFVITSKIPA